MAVIVHISLNHLYSDSRIYKKEICSIKDKFTVWYLTTDDCKNKDSEINTVVLKKRNGINGLLISLTEIKRALNKIDNINIVHIHDPVLLFLSFIKRKSWKIVYDKHEFYEGYYLWHIKFNLFTRWILSKTYSCLEFVSLKNVDAIIQVSDQMPKTRFPKNEIAIPNYPLKKEIKLIPFKDKKNDLVFLGSINRYRGLHKVIEVLPELPEETRFHIIGNFTDSKYEKKIRVMSGWEKVIYHGYLSHNEAESILANSKIGVMLFDDIPNHRYSLPTKYYEYIQYGLNVLDTKKVNASLIKVIFNLFKKSDFDSTENDMCYFDSVSGKLINLYFSLLEIQSDLDEKPQL